MPMALSLKANSDRLLTTMDDDDYGDNPRRTNLLSVARQKFGIDVTYRHSATFDES